MRPTDWGCRPILRFPAGSIIRPLDFLSISQTTHTRKTSDEVISAFCRDPCSRTKNELSPDDYVQICA